MTFSIITQAVTAMTAVTVAAIQPAPSAVAWSVAPMPAALGGGQSGGTLRINQDQVAWGALRHKVAAWSYLPADWDGDGGRAPSREATDAAISFLSRAERARVTLPRPFIEGDGEVGFEWTSDKGFASLGFLADGYVVGSVLDQVTGERTVIDKTFSSARYDDVLSRLATLV